MSHDHDVSLNLLALHRRNEVGATQVEIVQ